MSLQENIEFIKNEKIIFVVRSQKKVEAKSIAKAVVKGGVRLISFAYYIPDCLDLVKFYVQQKKILVGVSSVFTVKDLKKCIKAGVDFVTCPINNLDFIPVCRRSKVVSLIGAYSPTEMYKAQNNGADFVKVFPVSEQGGERFVEDIFSVFPKMNIMVVGGVDPKNIFGFFSLGVGVVSISRALVLPEDIEQKKWKYIQNSSEMLVKKVNDWKIKNGYRHFGVPLGK